jgi:hypothetical protein
MGSASALSTAWTPSTGADDVKAAELQGDGHEVADVLVVFGN